jgi:hypothetical protein
MGEISGARKVVRKFARFAKKNPMLQEGRRLGLKLLGGVDAKSVQPPKNASVPNPPAPVAQTTASTSEQNEIASRVWDAHEEEEYRRDISHWRGHGRWVDLDRWESMGKSNLDDVLKAARYAGYDDYWERASKALEWGPGGGTNLYACADRFRDLYAVDIAEKNLAESARVLAEKPSAHFTAIHLKGSLAEISIALPDDIDLFISTAVFQHFPSKAYGAEVLELVSKKMAPNSLGIIHIRFDNGNPLYAPKSLETYAQDHITATSYGIEEFWEMLMKVNLNPLFVNRIVRSANAAGFAFAKPG